MARMGVSKTPTQLVAASGEFLGFLETGQTLPAYSLLPSVTLRVRIDY